MKMALDKNEYLICSSLTALLLDLLLVPLLFRLGTGPDGRFTPNHWGYIWMGSILVLFALMSFLTQKLEGEHEGSDTWD